MKRNLFFWLLCLPLTMSAQGVWETPDDASTAAPVVKQAASKKANADARYLAGAVPEVDGKVVWTHAIDVPGKSAQQLYDIMSARLGDMVKEENQREGSRIALVNRAEHKLVARMKEWLVFRNTVLSLDRTEMDYTLQVECTDGRVSLIVDRISYLYPTGEGKKEAFKADTWITDKYSMNKKGTRLYRISGKFRRKTVDRMEEILENMNRLLTSE